MGYRVVVEILASEGKGNLFCTVRKGGGKGWGGVMPKDVTVTGKLQVTCSKV